ncbi:hypothetical protein B9Z19DRAFT_368232 [Tuber borchii]|uniref:Uncharacterized protein n=1 Tax=Tuber borchii TaxID=42251 RepID=A0A2T6ZI87_TUBBO|nr:hypothetical protein B9Z19DRAFT_368232 [Tuber borchii]
MAPAIGHPNLPSPQQLLEQEEFKWYLRFQEDTTEEEDKFYFQSQEGHPSTTQKHPQSPYDVQTSALNQPPHEKNATSNLTARGTPSRSYPIKVLPSTQQLLKQQEERWNQRLTDYASECREEYHRQSLEYLEKLYRRSDEWHAKSDEKNKEILKLSVQIEHLICDALYGKTEVMKLEENFNVKGALEHMVYYAKLRKKIGTDCPPETQAGLNELAKAPEFTKVLHDEVASRGLELKAVTSCIASVYNKVLRRARGNDYIITLYKEDYTANEGAVLAAFLRMQSEWSYGLKWREEANYPLS